MVFEPRFQAGISAADGPQLLKVSSTDDIDHPFFYSYDYTRKNYGDWKHRRILAALPPFELPDAKENKGEPPAPVYLNGPTDFIHTSKMKLPKGCTPQLPRDVNLAFDFADYHSQYRFQKGVMTINRTLSIKTDEVPAAADPVPRVWETAAESLTKFKQQLPVAQHYAEMEVKSDEAKAAKITIAGAGSDDLRLMGNMASDWGMLGWIYFKQNNLAEARKYLEAAWNLSQSETIGDRLGQLYEKLGNRQEAIRIYTMAAATTYNGKSDAQARLAHLLGHKASKNPIQIEGNRDDIQALNVKLGKISSAEGGAECLILFSHGPKVKGLKFTSGDQAIKMLGKEVRSAHFHILFPDSTTTQILRRGALVCVGRNYGCDVTLSPAHKPSRFQGY